MTKTIQPNSTIYVMEKDLHIQKPETEDNKNLLLTLFDGLNNLCEKLNRLNYLIQRREIKRILFPEGKGEKK